MTLQLLTCTVGRMVVSAIHLLGEIRRDPSLVQIKEQDREENHELHVRHTEFKKLSTHQKEMLTVWLDIQFWTKSGLEIQVCESSVYLVARESVDRGRITEEEKARE